MAAETSRDASSEEKFFHFPPFFTLQPVVSTRAEQLVIWRRFLLDFCRERRVLSLELVGSAAGPPFGNVAIGRQLDAPARREVADALIAADEAQWAVGAEGQRLVVWWRPRAQWAEELSSHLRDSGGRVFTMAELKASDGPLRGSSLEGLGPDVVRALVSELSRTGRATTFGAAPAAGSTDDDEVGVKLL